MKNDWERGVGKLNVFIRGLTVQIDPSIFKKQDCVNLGQVFIFTLLLCILYNNITEIVNKLF